MMAMIWVLGSWGGVYPAASDGETNIYVSVLREADPERRGATYST